MEDIKINVLINNELKEKTYKEDELTDYEKGQLGLLESEDK
jgi:hypothetical protein